MICVLMVAAGADWESRALGLLTATPDVMVLKRCVDVDDLLATASSGQAEVAVMALEAPGLDAAAVAHLERHRVRPVAVVADDGGSATDAARLRATRWGITTVVRVSELDRLGAAVRTPEGAEPRPDRIAGPEPEGSATPVAGGRVVVVWGPRGAPGRTTVAVGLAAVLAARGQRTLLVDADPYGGAVAQQLGVLDEVSGLLAAARLAASGCLAERFATVQRSLAPGLTAITGLPRPDRWAEVGAGTLEHIVELGRRLGQVVVDTGFSLEQDPAADFGGRPPRNSLTLGALQVADEVVVVGRADPVGLSRLARGLVDLREVLGPRPVRVVVNRHRSTLGWSEADVVGMVEGFAHPDGVRFLPEDGGAVDRAAVAGRTLVESGDSALLRALEGLAEELLPTTGGPGRSGRRRVTRRRAGRARRR